MGDVDVTSVRARLGATLAAMDEGAVMATPPAPVPVRERGYARKQATNGWWTDLSDEETPELRWPLSLVVYDRMRRQDAQVSSVLRAVTSPILRTQWRIDGSGCRPEVTAHVAADLGLPVVGQGNDIPVARTRDRFSWGEHLKLALLMLPFGHMAFEQVYRFDDAGMVHLRKLGPRMPRTIANINVARDGGLVSIEQYGNVDTLATVTLPVSRLVMYVLDREGGNWFGTSVLRTAYKNWLIKDRLLRTQAQTIERNGMGIPVYTGATGETDLSAGEEIATAIRAGDNSGAAIPGAPKGPGGAAAKLELMGVTGVLPDAEKPIRYHDEQIARAVLAHFLNLGTQTGSWALGSTFADFFTLSLQAVAEEIRSTASQHIVEDLVDLNWGREEPAPRLVFDEIGSRADATAEAIKVLVDAGVLTTDDDIEQFVRTRYGLPTRGGTTPPAPASEEDM